MLVSPMARAQMTTTPRAIFDLRESSDIIGRLPVMCLERSTVHCTPPGREFDHGVNCDTASPGGYRNAVRSISMVCAHSPVTRNR